MGSSEQEDLECRQYRIGKILEKIRPGEDAVYVDKRFTPEEAESNFDETDYGECGANKNRALTPSQTSACN